MARITGKTGNAVIATGPDPWDTFVVNVQSWSGDLSPDIFDADELGDTDDGHKFYNGMHVMTGTISGHLDDTIGPTTADFAPGAGTSSLTLTANTGMTYTFEARMTSLGLNVAKAPLNTYSWAFTSDGAVTPAQPA